MQVLKVYSIKVWDAAGKHNHKFYLSDRDEALQYVLENKYDIVEEKTIEVFDTLEEWKTWNSGEVKKRALAKLTVEERRVLGLEE